MRFGDACGSGTVASAMENPETGQASRFRNVVQDCIQAKKVRYAAELFATVVPSKKIQAVPKKFLWRAFSSCRIPWVTSTTSQSTGSSQLEVSHAKL
jgi:hypothetical protein